MPRAEQSNKPPSTTQSPLPTASDTALAVALRRALVDETDPEVRMWLRALLADADAIGGAA